MVRTWILRFSTVLLEFFVENWKMMLVSIGILALLLWAFVTGIERYERVECEKWKAQDALYPSFYTAGWQVEQCERYDIAI